MPPQLVVILLAVLMGSGSAWASPDNPFGFETTKPPLDYGYCRYLPDHLYRGFGYSCTAAPREHPDLNAYTVQFVPNVGVCSIEGTARHVPRDDLPALASKLTAQIVQKYGPDLEVLRDTSELEDGTAMAESFWVPQDGTPGIGDVAAIRLTSLQGTTEENWITVRVILTTMPACRTAMDRADQEEAQQD